MSGLEESACFLALLVVVHLSGALDHDVPKHRLDSHTKQL